jgi:hypothetical protein
MAAEPTAADLDFDFFLPFPLFPPADADAALAEGIVECTLVVDLEHAKLIYKI